MIVNESRSLTHDVGWCFLRISSWWLVHQPFWKILMWSEWVHLPQVLGVKITNIKETTTQICFWALLEDGLKNLLVFSQKTDSQKEHDEEKKQHMIVSRLEHFQLFALDQGTSNPTIKMRISCLPILGWQPAFLGGKVRSIRNAPGFFFLQRKKTRLKWFRNSASLRVHVCWPCREKKGVQSASALPRVFSACAIGVAMSVISLDVLPSDFSLPPSIHRNPSLKRCHILVKARPMAAENSKVTEFKKKRRNGPGLRLKPKQLEPPITYPWTFFLHIILVENEHL